MNAAAVARRPAVVAVGGVVVLYLLAYVAPGSGPWLADVAPFAVVLIGVIFGTVTALGAVALILTYRSNRFINFAFGTMGSVAGLNAIGMHRQHGVPFFVVLPIGVAVGVGIGAAVEILVLRRFKNAPRLVLTVASIGLAQLLGGIEIAISRAIDFVSLGGGFKVPLGLEIDLGIKTLAGDEILILLVTPALLAGLAWFLLRTDTGIAVRAAAENRDRALVLGVPVRRNTTIIWMVAGGLATLTFILKAPLTGVQPGVLSAGPSVLLPALAAAVVARMESLPVALVAGIGLGILDQVVRWNSSGTPSVIEAVLLGVIVVALLLQRGRRGRTDGEESSWSAAGALRPIPDALRRLPEVRIATVGGLVLVGALAVIVPGLWSPSNQLLASFAMTWAMVGVSLVVLTGWGGSISLGQFGIVGVGAMVAGNLISSAELDLIFVLLLSGLAGALVALVIGIPALRIGSLLLAVTTIAFAAALDGYFLNSVNFASLIPNDVPRPVLLGRFDLEDQYAMYLFCLAILGLTIALVAGLRATRTGRLLVATRDNTRAAAGFGVRVARAKLNGFLLAGAIAGVAGALHVQLLHSLNPGSYPVEDSITVFSTAVIGGLGSPAGAVIGVLSFRWLETLTALGPARLAITGFGLLVVLYALPGGLGQILLWLRDRALGVVAARRGIEIDKAGAAAGSVAVQVATAAARDHAPVDDGVLLACRCLELGYDQLQVVPDLDLDIRQGEMVALLGTNGAGKSTLLRGVSGLLAPRNGSVVFGGVEIAGHEADAVAAMGMSMIPGGRGVFPSLTVAENLKMASWLARRRGDDLASAETELFELFPVLAERSAQLAGDLSGGEQQMLSLASALLCPPRLLLIDELSLGLAPAVVSRLLDVVREIHRRGATVLLVEQSVSVALDIAERAVFLERGVIRYEGPTRELLQRDDLLRSVFITGGKATRARRPRLSENGSTPTKELACTGLRKRFGGIVAVDDVDLTVAPGEIVGLIGHNGAGKTTLLDGISGFLPLDGGRVVLGDDDVSALSAAVRATRGLGRSFQDARLFPALTVTETIAVARERHVASRSAFADSLRLPASFESEAAVAIKVEELIERLGLGAFARTACGELSTGTRRIVDLACTLATDPDVVLLDEPSSGVAQREVEALAGLLLDLRAQSHCSMLIVEHDMPLLRAIADRLVALELGAVIAEGKPKAVLSHPAVLASYLGTPA